MPFKQVTLANWLEPDPTLQGLVSLRTLSPLSPNDWAAQILELHLSDEVPDEIYAMYEAARNIMLFGCFFYPLFSAAEGQLFRVANAAIAHKCVALHAPKGADSFARKLDWLRSEGLLSKADWSRWGILKDLRNSTSHPEHHSHGLPAMAIRMFRTVGEAIDNLFARAN